ncbi:MAG: DegT/DnrJ/EryC1/StrS family aminotransferase, partial [Thermodesulfobacteriota bacterium]
MKKRRMLITGVSGLLGNNLAYFFKESYEVTGLYLNHPVTLEGVITSKCDLTVKRNVAKALEEFMPEIVIHCASLTNVDKCEKDTCLAEKLNHLCAKNIVDCLIDKPIKPVYISTDAVYSGERENSCEDDSANPQNYYGISKYMGELEFRRKKQSLILRTYFFGWNIQDKESIGEWVLNSLKSSQEIHCFKDALFSCIYTFDFARVLDKAIHGDLCGVFNCGTHNSVSKYKFALNIADVFGLERKYIVPSSTKDHPFAARRGLNLSMNVRKIENALNVTMPTIEDSIDNYYEDYQKGLPERIKAQKSEKSISLIPYGRQYINDEDIKAVIETLESSYLTQGPKVKEFEDALCHTTGAQFAVAVNSGTSALSLACLVAGVSLGDEVMTSPNTFVASA